MTKFLRIKDSVFSGWEGKERAEAHVLGTVLILLMTAGSCFDDSYRVWTQSMFIRFNISFSHACCAVCPWVTEDGLLRWLVIFDGNSRNVETALIIGW